MYSAAACGHPRAAAGCEFADTKGGAQQHHPASIDTMRVVMQDEATGDSREVNRNPGAFADAAPFGSEKSEPDA